jgi:sec-independent protein translocase protein TatA
MYLFILESIGTSELILIGIVALIIFGPRKLPQMAKTLGKMMAEFRSATNEFKTTWQKEASFEEESNQIKNIFEDIEAEIKEPLEENSTKELSSSAFKPEIREVDVEEIREKFELEEKKNEPLQNDKSETSKREWL